jgi:RimJ/RimL family protein N-acetyltransferase
VCSVPQTINPRSARVAQRIGMQYERSALLGPTETREGVEIDLYWITRQEWSAERR